MTDIHKLAGAYALDAVDDIERMTFERHLDECEDCRAEVVELRETAALLAESVTSPPPPALRDSVLSGISQIRPAPPVVGPSRAFRRWVPALVAAAVLAVAGVTLSMWQPWSTAPDQPRLTAAERVLQAPDAQSVDHDFEDGSSAQVVRSADHGQAVIVTDDMAPAPSTKVYELWLMIDGEFVPAGLLPNEADHTMLLDGDATEATAVGITVEPAGGSPQPTTDPIALFDLSQAA